jgi:ABC-type transport system substrate-binding protein
VLVANPDYRAIRFPAAGDPRHAALSQQMAGRVFPRIGVIDIAIINEDLPRVLEFERGNLDFIRLYSQIATRLLTGDAVRADLAARGIRRVAVAEAYSWSFTFNLEDPVVGGLQTERIALRRAVALGTDVSEMIAVVFGGQALPARQLVPPPVAGHDPTLHDRAIYEPAAARALLDRMGYTRRDADGYRMTPQGAPLTLTWSLRSGGISTEMATLIRKNMAAIGLRAEFHMTPFQDMLKELEAGKFSIYYGGYGGIPNGYGKLMQLFSRAPKAQNQSRFARADYDALMETFLHTNEASAQAAAAVGMARIAEAWGPMVPLVYRLENNFVQPWLEGYVPPLFDIYWKYLDIDLARRPH